MKKILTVVGARPQFIKAAVLSRKIKQTQNCEEIIVHTGQHFDAKMSDIFFDEMDIPKPHYSLDINSLSHGAMTGRMLEEIEKVVISEKPDLLMVYGDTNTTLAGALAAKKLHVKVAHVEAGLRSYNMNMPEEINRILTDRISDLLFCPTQTAVDNLIGEGYKAFPSSIFLTGDIMFDAAVYYSQVSAARSKVMSEMKLEPNGFILCTIHRQENTDDLSRLKDIIFALNEIQSSIPVIVPLHPRTKKILDQHGIVCHFKVIEPIGYFDMIELLKNCRMVITDSGGLQKEAYYFLKNSIILRDQTEWLELIENNFSVLVGAEKTAILRGFEQMMQKENPVLNKHLFGDGNSADLILTRIIQ